MNKSLIRFLGGVGNATGSNFLFEIGEGGALIKALIDCGLVQGSHSAVEENRRPFPYDPSAVEFLFVTHAHADHIGRIPKLVRDGFRGSIYSTLETKLISELMFEDSLKIMQREAFGKESDMLYTATDVFTALSLWKEINYSESLQLRNGVSVTAKDAGHILGSAYYEFERVGKKFVFSGDLGNSPSLLLNDTEPLKDADYLLVESVYGDRNHEDKDVRSEKLKNAVKKIFQDRGTLVIPAFSIERTQMILFELNGMVEGGEIEPVPVYLDSPLAIKVTDIYRKMRRGYKQSVKEQIERGDDIFSFPRLKLTPSHMESGRIELVPGPKIIIAASGMSEGGRIMMHEQNYLPNPNNTILLVGYQAVGTLGREIQEGSKEVIIDGVRVPVNAKVEIISGYSSHKDSDHLVEFVGGSADSLKKVFVVMGEPKSSFFLAQRIKDEFGIDASVPEAGSSVQIEF